MHLELRKVLGDEVGNTVMEHLPPRGWGDVARTVEVTHVSERLIQAENNLALRIDHLSARIDHIETRLQGITNTLRLMIGSMVTISAAIIVMLVQINQNL
jgi:chaperonin cofactor prefoldin